MSVISKEEKGLQSRHLFTMFPFSGFRDRVNSTGSITSCCAFEANQGLMRFTVCCVHHMLKGISSIYLFFSVVILGPEYGIICRFTGNQAVCV
jgi:hypothetical protein